MQLAIRYNLNILLFVNAYQILQADYAKQVFFLNIFFKSLNILFSILIKNLYKVLKPKCDPCRHKKLNHCKNKGKCFNKNCTAICACKTGYYGKLCEKPILRSRKFLN